MEQTKQIEPIQDDLKICKKCERPWPATPDFFISGPKGTLTSECKICRKAYNSSPEVRKRNNDRRRMLRQRPEIREEQNAKRRMRYHSDPKVRRNILDKQKIYDKRPGRREQQRKNSEVYRVRHRDFIRQTSLARYHQPEVHEQQKAYRKVYENRPEVREHRSNYRKTPKSQAARQAYRESPIYQERNKFWQRTYYQQHREQYRARVNTRRARKNSAPGHYTVQDMRKIYESQEGKCYWCQRPITWDEREDDHIIPLTRGGSNWPSNMCAACQRCNRSRNNKLPHEWQPKWRQIS